jgi:hypothetical protein
MARTAEDAFQHLVDTANAAGLALMATEWVGPTLATFSSVCGGMSLSDLRRLSCTKMRPHAQNARVNRSATDGWKSSGGAEESLSGTHSRR